jgi:hypothetical protein
MHLFSRGNKAENAAKFGCAALIIFSDPAEAAQEGTEPEHVYPESFWLPGTGVQRGSLALADGDPLTPNWPSVDHAYRLDLEERQVRSAEKTRANSLRSCFKRAPCFAFSCLMRMISAHYADYALAFRMSCTYTVKKDSNFLIISGQGEFG